jgi:hypothetical protein
MYQSGKGVQRDLDEAEGWYQRAVHSDPQRAEFYLASVYMEKHDFQQALEWFERSASRGYAAATYQLGRIYRFGVGVGVDRQRGFEYIEQAAQKGHLFARRDIAREMLRGHRGLSRIPSGLFVARECGLECL